MYRLHKLYQAVAGKEPQGFSIDSSTELGSWALTSSPLGAAQTYPGLLFLVGLPAFELRCPVLFLTDIPSTWFSKEGEADHNSLWVELGAGLKLYGHAGGIMVDVPVYTGH